MRKYLNLRPNIALGLILAFLINTLGPLPAAQADEFHLPAPGVMVPLSPEFNPPILKGIKVHPDNPFRFDFILDQGNNFQNQQLKTEASRLIKYFLASLTIPEKDLWVNLSPYEKDRIIPSSFGLTEMGRDLLAEDYMLKQITASLVYPEDGTGKKFWKRVYEEAFKKFGTTNIPVNTFNKVWIVPEKAVVYENAKAGTAYVVEAKLKVMLEQDYLSLQKHSSVLPALRNNMASVGADIVREIVIPQLDKEVNTGKSFSQLRQVYNSLILAAWYKKKIKDSILAQVYEDKNKIQGLVIPAKAGIQNKNNVEAIYQRYLQAFKKGAYNYIKEEQDPITQQMVPRKYFSGGMSLINLAMTTVVDGSRIANGRTAEITVNLVGLANRNPRPGLSVQDRGFLKTIDGLTVGGKYKFEYTGRKPRGESPDSGVSDVFIINGTKRVKGAGADASYLMISPLNMEGYVQDGRVKLVVESFRLKYEEDQRKGILRAFLDRLPQGTIYKSESIINVPTILYMLNEILKQPLFIETISPGELEVIRSFISTLMSNPDIYNVKLFEPACHFMAEYMQKAKPMHLKSLDDIFIESPVGQGLEKAGLPLQRVGFETRWKYFSMYAINIKDQAMQVQHEKTPVSLDQLRELVNNMPGNKYLNAERWFTPYLATGLDEEQLKAMIFKAFHPAMWDWDQGFLLSQQQERIVVKGVESVALHGDDHLAITSIGVGDTLAETVNVLVETLDTLDRSPNNVNSITLRFYDHNVSILNGLEAKLSRLLTPLLEKRFPKWKGRINIEMFYLDIVEGMRDQGVMQRIILPSNIILFRNTWTVNPKMSRRTLVEKEFKRLLNILRVSISVGALIVEERSPYFPRRLIQFNEVMLPENDHAMQTEPAKKIVIQDNIEGLGSLDKIMSEIQEINMDASSEFYQTKPSPAFVHRVLKNPPSPWKYAFAIDPALGNKIIGYVFFTEIPAANSPSVYVNNIAVSSLYQRNQAGVGLMKKVFNYADHLKLPVHLDTSPQEGNKAIAFFRSLPKKISGISIIQDEITPTSESWAFKYRVLQGNDHAMINSLSSHRNDEMGGIDLTPARMNLQTQNSHGEIKFHMDPAMLQQLQNAPGFVPIIVNIRTITDLRLFLGIDTLR